MRKFRTILVVMVLLALAWSWQQGEFAVPPGAATSPQAHPSVEPAPGPALDARVNPPPTAAGLPDFQPPEAADTLAFIERGGPFPHRQDGSTFQNREGILPDAPRGYYREYTVETPGSPDRGARRIVTGRDGERYYTDDHYDSFRFIVGEAGS